MSSSDLKKTVGAFITKNISKTTKRQSKGTKKSVTRAELERQEGQVFVVNWTEVELEVNNIASKFGISVFTTEEFSSLKTKLNKFFSTKLSKPKKSREFKIDGFIEWLKRKNNNPNLSYYVVKNYSTVSQSKAPGGKLNNIIGKAIKEKSKKQIDKSELNQKISGGQQGGSKVQDLSGFQIGHGQFGGFASSTISVAKLRSAGLIKFASGTKERDLFLTVIHDYETALDIDLSHRQIITSRGDLIKDYKVIISMQSAKSNQEDGNVLERAVFNILKEKARQFVTKKTSTKLSDAIGQKVLDGLTVSGKIKHKGRLKPKKSIKEKASTSLKAKAKFNRKRKIVKVKSVVTKVGNPVKGQSRAGSSIINLQTLINLKLPKTVKENMGLPRLVNRTGRFAESVRVTNVVNSRKGVVINYTYQLNPYAIFESTPPWYTADRNPKVVIDESIREIAFQITKQRFITRRI